MTVGSTTELQADELITPGPEVMRGGGLCVMRILKGPEAAEKCAVELTKRWSKTMEGLLLVAVG